MVLLIYQLKPEGVVNNWLLVQFAGALQCAAMSAVCLFCERSCFSTVALLVVTISFVIAANITTLKTV